MRVLYHLPLSPHCRKVRLALAEKRIPFELRLERVWERRPEFLDLNPAGMVPVLEEENGLVLADSYVICEYLDEAYPETPL
ncbi:MAG: glutathione S-transferase family protein, partial [Roseomonas mucosa]|nr:glutathione S-transferase family protein [Roseomonas mucosa]